jgi:hypothetical protein
MASPAHGGFDHAILEVTGHRPWPMPGSAWVMTQTWHDLLFAHWPVDGTSLRAKIPSGFQLDLFDGQAWLGIVPFRMTNVAPRFVPALPWISAFPELNVRTYVRAGGKPGCTSSASMPPTRSRSAWRERWCTFPITPRR